MEHYTAEQNYEMYLDFWRRNGFDTYKKITDCRSLVHHSWNGASYAVWLLALYDVLGIPRGKRDLIAIEMGTICAMTRGYDSDADLVRALLRWFHENIRPLPVPEKPERAPWRVWAPGHVFRWIRDVADDPESLCYELRRKWTDDKGGHRWRMTLYPPDGSEVYIGYCDDLDQAKAYADVAWELWPLPSPPVEWVEK